MPQFDTSTYVSQIFWLALCFATLLIAMRWFLIPRLEKSMNLRSRQINEDHDYAIEYQSESTRIAKDGDEQIKKARHEASDFIRKQVEEMNAEKVMILHDFEATLQQKIMEAKQEILKQSYDFQDELPKIVEETVLELRNKLLPELTIIKDEEIKAVAKNLIQSEKKEVANGI